MDDFPLLDACDLLSYLVLRTSFIYNSRAVWSTMGLEVYNQFVCGWVKEVFVCKVDTKFVTTGRVRILRCGYQFYYATFKCFTPNN